MSPEPPEWKEWVPMDDDPEAWFETVAYVAAQCFPYDPTRSRSNLDRVTAYEVYLFRLGKLPKSDEDPFEQPF